MTFLFGINFTNIVVAAQKLQGCASLYHDLNCIITYNNVDNFTCLHLPHLMFYIMDFIRYFFRATLQWNSIPRPNGCESYAKTTRPDSSPIAVVIVVFFCCCCYGGSVSADFADIGRLIYKHKMGKMQTREVVNVIIGNYTI